MSEVNTLLIGRNRLFLEGLKSLLGGSSFIVRSEAASVADLERFDEERPELILIELRDDLGELVEDLNQLHEDLPEAPVVVLTDARRPFF